MTTQNATPRPTAYNPWPYFIVGWFVIFSAALIAWILFAVQQKTDLVRVDYYEDEVHFQGRLDQLNRTAAIRNELNLSYNAIQHEVTLRLPSKHLNPRPRGHVEFYRPANAQLDFTVPLAVDGVGRQTIGAGTLRGGLWKVRVQWQAQGHEFYFEQVIVVNEPAEVLAAATLKLR